MEKPAKSKSDSSERLQVLRQLIRTGSASTQEELCDALKAKKFDVTQSWYLPVLNKERKFAGFISKTKLFNKYREILAAQGDLYDETN